MAKNNAELEQSQPSQSEPAPKKSPVAKKSVPKAEAAPVADVVSVKKTVKNDTVSEKDDVEKSVIAKASAISEEQNVVSSVSTASTGDVPTSNRRNYKKLAIVTISAVLAVLFVVTAVFGVLVYKYKSESPVVKSVAAVIPYPVMKVNGDYISYSEYLFELASIKQYYKKQTGSDGKPSIDFNAPEGKAKLAELKKQILAQLKTDEVARQLIEDRKIKVTDKELDTQYETLVKSAGGKVKLKEVLSSVYGWTPNDLKRKLKFQLEKQKLQKAVTSDPSANSKAKAKAQDVLNKVNAGGDFAALAKQYSQDTTAANGGDLGFFSKGQMVKEFEASAFGLQPGQVSGLVKTQYGYHIIKVIEYNEDKTQVHASHILIKTVDFNEYLTEQNKNAKVTTYLKA